MEFFNSAVGVLQTLVVALGAGLGIWGVINLLEGYGQDNPASKSQGIKQFMAAVSPSSASPLYLCSPACSVDRPAVIAYGRHTRQTR